MNKAVTRILIVFLLAISSLANAQMLDPVKWAFEYKKISDTEGELLFKANIQDGWHLYSQYNPPSKDGLGGAIPMLFNINTDSNFELIGKVEEPPYTKEYNDIWESDEYYHKGSVVFKQKIKVKAQKPFTITGNVSGQACKEMCVPVGSDFSFEIKPK